jgi:uncharacterized protein (TIGR03083 family)
MNPKIDWEECATEYAACARRVDTLISETPEQMWSATVQACPDWTVADVCAHLAAIPTALVAGDTPSGDTDAWVAEQIVQRAGRTPSSLLDEWNDSIPAFQQMMVSAGGSAAGMILDAIAHEHDLRQTLDRPGARDSRGVEISMAFTRLIMHGDLKNAGSGTVRVVADGTTWQAGPADEPTIRLDLSGREHGTFEAFRLFGSRRSASQVAQYPWVGDWEAAADGLFHMPLPEADLIE